MEDKNPINYSGYFGDRGSGRGSVLTIFFNN